MDNRHIEHLHGKELERLFNDATKYFESIAPKLPADILLKFYARYKQAKEGPCNIEKPGFFNFQAKEKWNAWNSLGNMCQDRAMQEYIGKLTEIDPEWTDKNVPENSSADLGWVSVSTMAKNDDDEVPEDEKTLINFIQDQNLTKIEECLRRKPNLVKKKDTNGMLPLHWAADRGDVEIIELLLEKGSDVNSQDSEGQSALHYACSVGHEPAIKILLKHKINLDIKDSEGQTAMDLIENVDLKRLFS